MKHKRTILLILLVAGAALAYFALSGRTVEKTVAVQAGAPSFEVADMASGRIVRSTDLRGKVVFVNFWASWCQPCKEEMSSVDALYRQAFPKGNFVMVTILYKDTPERASEEMRAQGVSFPVYTDPGENASAAFRVTGVPETYVIDKGGTLRKRVIGPADWSSPQEIALIDSLLKE